MKSISSSIVAAASLLLASLASADPLPKPHPVPTTSNLNAMTSEGCFSSSTGLTYENTYIYQTSGYCQPICVDKGFTVVGLTNKTDCWCGNTMPPKASLVDDSYCDDTCAGYSTESCGDATSKYFTVWLDGKSDDVDYADEDGSSTTTAASSSTASATTSAKPSTVTVGGQTIVVTASGQVETESSSSGKSTNTAAIAAGVVVGVVGLSAIIGGGYFYMRYKRRREVEEEYRRNAAVNSFVNSGKPSSAGASSFSDARLDPVVMAQRRMSDGSIADDQDYSRRILKVINV